MIVITGASRGIGRACAERFAAAGCPVLAIARGRADLLAMGTYWDEHFPTSQLVTFSADLCTPAGCQATALFLRARKYAVTALINNVGAYQAGGLLAETDIFERFVHLNLLAAHRISRTLLPGMVANGAGHLITIGSVGAEDFAPHMTAYCASKYALHGWHRALVTELSGTGVRTTLLVPGATLTSAWKDEDYDAKRILAPDRVADAAWYAFSAPVGTDVTELELRPPA